MSDPTVETPAFSFNGLFELRNWEPPHAFETPSGVITWELSGMLVSCQSAVLSLESKQGRKIKGKLQIDSNEFPLEAEISLKREDQVIGHVEIPRHRRTFGFNFQLRRNRLTATLFARNRDDEPVAMQELLFYRMNEKGPPRRTPETAPAPIAVAKPPSVPTPAPPAAPARAAAPPAHDDSIRDDWIRRLRNTKLSDAWNDPAGGSGYIERVVTLQLYEDHFVLRRSSIVRVSGFATDASGVNESAQSGTWTVLVLPARTYLTLKTTEGKELLYRLGAVRNNAIAIDGKEWAWRLLR
jgi:hypothetical protein